MGRKYFEVSVGVLNIHSTFNSITQLKGRLVPLFLVCGAAGFRLRPPFVFLFALCPPTIPN